MSSYSQVSRSSQPISKESQIGIIGAGPAGISVAHFLKKEGYKNITVLESSSHIAGKSATFNHEGRGYDVGALMVGTNYTNVKSLATELGCPMETFTGRALNMDDNSILVNDTNKIGIYSKLLPHMSHYLEEKQSFLDISRPGHGILSETELYAPISQFLKDRGMTYLKDVWSLAYTSAGYGYIQDDIPAAYLLKFIENSENTISYFRNGFQDFWSKMAQDLNVLCNYKVTSIDRSLKEKNVGPILVTVTKTENNLKQTFAFDEIIIATNPRQTEQFINPTPLEKNIFSQIVTFDFYTIIATVKNLPTKVGMTTIPKHCSDKRFVGHVTAFYCAYDGVPTYLFYAYGNSEIGSDKIVENLKQDIETMGGELEKIHYHQRWDFFPHVSSLSMRRNFYSKVENVQGKNGTYYTGGWLDFELTENCIAYSRDLVRRFFNLSGKSEEPLHLPILPQIDVKPASTLNWGMLLRLAAKRYPDKIAFTWVDGSMKEETRITYSELYKQARSVAHYLRNNAGHKIGDPIMLCYSPGLKFLPILFGCMLAGIIAVPIAPPNLATADKDITRFRYLAQTTKAKIVFCDRNYMLYTKLYTAKSYLGLGKKIDWPEGLTWVEGEAILNSDLYEEKLIDEVNCESVAVLQFSSGSTGDPKGVMLTHKNLLHNVDLMQNEINLTPDDTIAFWVPQFHDLGLIGGFLNTVRGGARGVVMSPLTFLQRPESWLQMITNYQATFTAAPNFAYELVTRKCDPNNIKNLNLNSLRGAFNGAEPVRWSTLRTFSKKFESAGFKLNKFKCLYGLAEHCAYSVGFRNLHDMPTVIDIDPVSLRSGQIRIRNDESSNPLDNNNPQANYIVSTGVPNKSMQVEVVIVDQETRQICSPNTIGEVWVSSPSVGQGYYGREELSDQIFRAKLNNDDHGGWVKDNASFLRTGDLGFMYDNELYITGRHKDVIIINGKNHYPQDIELTAQEASSSIRPGCICAVNNPDIVNGTDSLIILLEIRQQKEVKKELLQEICDSVARSVPKGHSVPCSRIVILKQHSIPKTTSGKLQRAKAKTMLLDGSLNNKILMDFGEETVKDLPNFEINEEAKSPVMDMMNIQKRICVHVHRVSKLASKLPLEEIDVKANLITTYGFDSLAAVQLTSCLKYEFNMEVAPSLLLDLPTISDLAGYLSKQLLSSETSEEEFEEDDDNLNQIRQTISTQVHAISKIASKLPKNKLDIKANLITDYGFDSLAAVQLTATMGQKFGLEIAPALLYDIHTITDLSDHVHKMLLEKKRSIKKKTKKRSSIITSSQGNGLTIEDDGKEAPVIIPLAPMNVVNKHNPPLYCIHPLLGNVASYVFLAKNLGINRPVYGIQAPSDVEDDIKVIATRYVRAIQLHRQQNDQPYYLCGYSYGGLLAWEMAKLLGAQVGGLYLIDAPAPLQKRVHDTPNDEEQPHISWKHDIDQLLNDVDPQWVIRSENEDSVKIETFKKQIGRLISSMYTYTDHTIMDTVQQFPIHYWRAKDFAGKTSKLLLDHPSFYEPNFGWEQYKGMITFHRPIPGNHYNILRDETGGRLAREFDMTMPLQSRRGSLDLKPLMLEKVATSLRGISPNSSSGKNGSSTAFPLVKGSNKNVTSMIMNVQIPLPIAMIMMFMMVVIYSTIKNL